MIAIDYVVLIHGDLAGIRLRQDIGLLLFMHDALVVREYSMYFN